jgi:1,2-phenylacetyl-CoA epoxidase catalytic subunit
MDQISEQLKMPLAQLCLSIADDKLILGHRNSDWTGLGPILEEDIAFSHLAQDERRMAGLYQFVGSVIGKSSDELAFGRNPEAYRCAHIFEVPDDVFDWATAMARKVLLRSLDLLRLQHLSNLRTSRWQTCRVASPPRSSSTSITSTVDAAPRRGTDESRAHAEGPRCTRPTSHDAL